MREEISEWVRITYEYMCDAYPHLKPFIKLINNHEKHDVYAYDEPKYSIEIGCSHMRRGRSYDYIFIRIAKANQEYRNPNAIVMTIDHHSDIYISKLLASIFGCRVVTANSLELDKDYSPRVEINLESEDGYEKALSKLDDIINDTLFTYKKYVKNTDTPSMWIWGPYEEVECNCETCCRCDKHITQDS